MKSNPNISIIGLGLIGGSLAKALRRKYPDLLIAGFDKNSEYTAKALSDSVINIAPANIEDAVKDSDIIFLCTPVGTITQILMNIGIHAKDGAIITDTGSTKQNIVETADFSMPAGVHFIGGHPMTGTEHSGYHSSIPHLFENAYYILTPQANTPKSKLDALKMLLFSIGAIPIVMDAQSHDYIVGGISHLPHVIASSLVNVVDNMQDPNEYKLKLAAGGFRDITRIASSDPNMWRDISLSNKKHLQNLIASVIDGLKEFNACLEDDSTENILSFFKDAKEYRDKFKNTHFATTYHELYVDIEDRPGHVGKVTTLLGTHDINIKNLRIINNREDEPGGCLVISLSDPDSVKESKSLLSANGFKCYER